MFIVRQLGIIASDPFLYRFNELIVAEGGHEVQVSEISTSPPGHACGGRKRLGEVNSSQILLKSPPPACLRFGP